MKTKIRKILEFLKNEFVYGGHLLSLGAASIVFTAAVLLDIGITWDFLLIAYLITYIAYSYNRLVEFKSDFLTNPLRTRHIEGHIRFLPTAIIFSLLIAIALSLNFGNLVSMAFVMLMIVGSLLYTVLFKGLTRDIVGFKSFYVTFFWALLVILLAFYYDASPGISVLLVFYFIFLRVLANAIFCDIKDIDSDKLCGLKTLPVYLGKRNVLIVIHVLNVLSFFPLLLGVYEHSLPSFSLGMIVFYFYTLYYLKIFDEDNVNIQNLSYIMVDGEYILWPLVIFYFRALI